MSSIISGIIAIITGGVFLVLMAYLTASLMRISPRQLEEEIVQLMISALLAGIFLAGGAFSLPNSIDNYKETKAIEAAPTIQEQCEENAICYELVETVAEYTDYTEQEIVDFFVIVSDDIDAWTAIRLLDSSLTEGQINAILEISAMKQAK